MLTLKEGRIIDQWSTLMEECQGEGEGLLQMVESNLDRAKAPGVNWKRESVSPGWLKGLMGKRRDFLLVSNERFVTLLMAVSARDYGTSLDVAWYLTGASSAGAEYVAGLDVFDQQDFSAYVTVVHRAVLRAVEELMQKRNIDIARLDRKSRGAFAVS